MTWKTTPLICPDCGTKREVKRNDWYCPKCKKREIVTNTKYSRNLKK